MIRNNFPIHHASSVAGFATEPPNIHYGNAYLTGDQAIGEGVYTRVDLDSASVVGSKITWDGTLYRFDIKTGGTYDVHMSARVWHTNGSTGGNTGGKAVIYKNGLIVNSDHSPIRKASTPIGQGWRLELLAGDYIQLYAMMDEGNGSGITAGVVKYDYNSIDPVTFLNISFVRD